MTRYDLWRRDKETTWHRTLAALTTNAISLCGQMPGDETNYVISTEHLEDVPSDYCDKCAMTKIPKTDD